MTKLDTLPLILLESICEYLEFSDTERKSLYAFSLTTRHCQAAAAKLRFRRVRINFRNLKELLASIKKWNCILAHNHATSYVRYVHVLGGIYHSLQSRNRSPEQVWTGIGGTLLNPPDGPGYCDHEHGREYPERAANVAWKPLADLIASLSNVQDFVYAADAQLAPCVLAALHKYHPTSRLHMNNFHLNSLVYPMQNPQDVSPHELAIASSPCLYSIYMYWTPNFSSLEKCDYNAEAALAMAKYCAPNLKHAWLRHKQNLASSFLESHLVEQLNETRCPWLGFQPEKQLAEPKSKGSLDSLVLDGDGRLHKGLGFWAKITDWSVLKSIEILTNITPKMMREFAKLARKGKFKSLSSLGLRIRLEHFEGDFHMSMLTIDRAANSLLQHLPPLESISIYDFMGEETFQGIIDSHGATLLRLCFDVSPSHMPLSDIERLIEFCPGLKELKIPVLRTRGDINEVEAYRLLSQFTKMESMTIWYWVALVIGGDRAHVRNMKRRGLFENITKDYLVNSAMDATLARSIFQTLITSTGAESSPSQDEQPGPRLQYLKLESRGIHHAIDIDDFADPHAMDNIMKWLARTCTCEWGRWTDDDTNNISVREEIAGDPMYCHKPFKDMVEKPDVVDKVWREIWPVQEESDDRMNSWSSLPLKTGE